MKAIYIKQLIILFVAMILITNMQLANAGTSKWKLFKDCTENKGWKPDKLIDICTKAIDGQMGNKKNLAAIYMMRGNGYEINHETDKALNDYNRSIELDPTRYDALLDRAGAWAAKGAYNRAISDVNTVIKKHFKFAMAYYFRSQIWLEMGDFKNAIKDSSYAVRLNPRSPRFLNMACWTKAVADVDLQNALFSCTKALRWSRNMAEISGSRSLVNLRLNKFEDAIKDANQALKIKPKLASSLFVRGIARIRLGQKEEGNADIAAAKEFEPDVEQRYANWGVKP